ncbi:BlaI/MecI/CopY family transcriptional regulator [Streptomyces inhibens]|uniref:BlaI/MecI/CopY family transcriptional regulator n=1 Tax=Streptomyces inhibens TaxID=2293571 RepID=UPI0036CE0168
MGGKSFGKALGDSFGGPGRERARRRGQGQLESQVLAALHHSPGPATAAWVQERLGGDLAYTTVMTILSRLHAKQAVTRERSGRAYVWTPAADEAGLAALRMRRVLDGEPDRDAVLTSFVSALSAHDEQLLRALLDRATADDPATPDASAPADGPATAEAPTTAPGPGRHHPSDEARGG